MPNLCTRGSVCDFITHTRACEHTHSHTIHTRVQTGGGGDGGTLLGTLGRCAQTVLRPGFDHIFASATALRPITVNKNPCLHVVNLIIFSLSLSLSLSYYIFRFSSFLYVWDTVRCKSVYKKSVVLLFKWSNWILFIYYS